MILLSLADKGDIKGVASEVIIFKVLDWNSELSLITTQTSVESLECVMMGYYAYDVMVKVVYNITFSFHSWRQRFHLFHIM